MVPWTGGGQAPLERAGIILPCTGEESRYLWKGREAGGLLVLRLAVLLVQRSNLPRACMRFFKCSPDCSCVDTMDGGGGGRYLWKGREAGGLVVLRLAVLVVQRQGRAAEQEVEDQAAQQHVAEQAHPGVVPLPASQQGQVFADAKQGRLHGPLQAANKSHHLVQAQATSRAGNLVCRRPADLRL